jgi:uncharacterized protein YjiS (DUF1127 family)
VLIEHDTEKEATMPTVDLFLPPETYPVWRPARRDAPTPKAPTPPNVRTPIHPLAAAWILIEIWIGRVRQRRALAELDDKMLRDIGITRYDAARECGKPF